MTVKETIKRLQAQANPANVAGMARFGINPHNTLGISVVTLRKFAKEIGKEHQLAQELWESGIHEARLLAAFVDISKEVTEKQMEEWVLDFDSWDVCDQVCMNLFDKTPFAYGKAKEWAGREKEFVKRAGYVMMAVLAVHDKKATDAVFIKFFPLIKKGATDERNFVKKAVNWALRQIGKKNENLRKQAITLAREIAKIDSKSARWVARDALAELQKKAK